MGDGMGTGGVVEADSAAAATTANKPRMRLSVVVPARNEAARLGECLRSLVEQSEAGFELGVEWELIVVDDDSTDGTREIAREFERKGVVAIEAPSLDLSERGGFTGKTNACWAGAQCALSHGDGEWFLFTDADTVHEPGDLSRALHEAKKYGAALLSYSPRQIVTGFWQRAVMPLVFSELASVYPPKQVSDPAIRLAAANGQFLLVEREAYFAVGGHRVVGQEILEDVALARKIKRARHGIRFRYAPDALASRMYRTLPEMVEGWTKNLALLFPRPLGLAAWRVLDLLLYFVLPVLALMLPVVAMGLPPSRLMLATLLLWLLWLRTLFRFYGRVARSNFPAADVAISIVGVPMFCWLLVRSYLHHRVTRSVDWKGRRYKTGR
jgi:cellulose synthase/poly-beta-1,6-N-acetylglucosamine synthase-like glycosyltransferase